MPDFNNVMPGLTGHLNRVPRVERSKNFFLMKRILLTFAILLAVLSASATEWKAEKLEKCDPYMTLQGGYGYLAKSGPKADVWWAEGVYKPMKDTPVAQRPGRKIQLTTAKNEYESFIIVVSPKDSLRNVKVALRGLPKGVEAKVRKVEYVNVNTPSDSFGYTGQWPDPLPLYDVAEDLPAGENTSFWITIKTPAERRAGTYRGRVVLKGDGWKVRIPLRVKVRPFALPLGTSVSSGYGLWFDFIKDYENLKTIEQQKEVFYKYLDTYLDYRIAPYDPFLFAPIVTTIRDDGTVDLDFTEFNKVAEKYFGEGGFNSFVVNVEGLGSCGPGGYHRGVFGGYELGTPEHEALMADYLPKLQAGLEAAGVLDKCYIYWGDEPLGPAYPYIREVHTLMKKYAPRIRTFVTEQVTWLEKPADFDVGDVTDISCVSWNCFDNHPKVFDYSGPGQEVWSYLCCATKYPYFTDFIDHNGIDMRLWLWATYMYGLKGILIWGSDWWNSACIMPEGQLMNVWDTPDCYGNGKDGPEFFACGDGILFYPHNRHPNEDKETAFTGDPIPSIRLEINRDGIEDYEYFKLLEARIPSMTEEDAATARDLLVLPESVFMDDDADHPEKYFIQDPQFLLERRELIANLIEKYL